MSVRIDFQLPWTSCVLRDTDGVSMLYRCYSIYTRGVTPMHLPLIHQRLERVSHPGREVIDVLAWRSLIEKRS